MRWWQQQQGHSKAWQAGPQPCSHFLPHSLLNTSLSCLLDGTSPSRAWALVYHRVGPARVCLCPTQRAGPGMPHAMLPCPAVLMRTVSSHGRALPVVAQTACVPTELPAFRSQQQAPVRWQLLVSSERLQPGWSTCHACTHAPAACGLRLPAEHQRTAWHHAPMCTPDADVQSLCRCCWAPQWTPSLQERSRQSK